MGRPCLTVKEEADRIKISYLARLARSIIDHPDHVVYYSVISAWETDIKHMVHPDAITISGTELISYCEEAGFLSLPVASRHVKMLQTLRREEDAPVHRDPFDRMMICQAKADGMLLLTHDRLLPYYREECIIPV